jgi:predicted DNA-binding transcriptional regulator AlpA
VKEKFAEKLSPNQIIRKRDGEKYFGYRHTQLDEKIKSGAIPEPIKLGPRARGWLGSQILEWQARLIAQDSNVD